MTFTPTPSVLREPDLADSGLRHLDGENDLHLAFPVMQQLRPHLAGEADFIGRVQRMRAEGYRLLGGFDSGQLVALAGYRLQENLVYGRFLYVDDLVTAETQRGQQWGARLLAALQRLAQATGCARLVLDTGLANTRAQHFYSREGLHNSATRFQKQFAAP